MTSLENKRHPKLAKYEECTGCYACIDVCHQQAIFGYINAEGHYDIEINFDLCVNCGRCERVCLNSRTNYGLNDLNKSEVFAGYTTDNVLRNNATSGGIFAAVAKKILHQGGVVVGASFDGIYAKHIIIDTERNISKLQGSKYTPSSMEGVYKRIESEIRNRKILFSGTGCQTAAVLAYFDNNPFKNNLYTIDLVCGGVPSTALIKKFLEHNGKVEIISFRNKDKYELRIADHYGEEKIIPSKNLPLTGFIYEMTNRYACYDCKYAFCHRKSDITIGDMWDKTLFSEEHDKGISTIITHNKKGKQLILESEIMSIPCSWDIALRSNRRIVCGKSHIYSLRRELRQNIDSLDYNKMKKLYCQEVNPFDNVLFFQKIYRHLRYRFEKKRDLQYIEKLLRRVIENEN